MPSLHRAFFFYLSAAFLLAAPVACQQNTSLSTVAPTTSQASAAVQPKRSLSTITIPITIPVAVLEQELNKQISGVLYLDEDMQPDDLAVKVTKAGPLRIKAEFSKLMVEIPLKVWAKGRWQWNACELCKSLQKTEETEFDMVIRTESRVQVTPTYDLKSYTTGDFAWGEQKPTIALGPLKINLAPYIEPKLKAQLNPMLQQLDRELQQRVNLQAYVKAAWQQLQQPFELNKQYGAWLTMEPSAIQVTPLELKQNQISLLLGLEAYINVATGSKPAAWTKPVPNLTPVRSLPHQARIEVATDMPFNHLQQLLKQEIQNKTFSFQQGKHQVTVHDAAVTGSGSKMLLELDVSGSAASGFITKKFKGKVFLTGIPYFDSSTQTIKIQDLDFEVNTRDQLINTANWLLHNTFKEQIQAQMNIPVKEQLAQLRQALQAGLSQQKVHDQVTLKGTVTSFEPDTLFVTPTGVRAIFTGTGQLSVHVQ